MKLRIAQYGLGPIGIQTLRLTATKPWAQIVGAIDNDPKKIGRDLGEISGVKRLRGIPVSDSLESLISRKKPNLIFHTAVSKLDAAYHQIKPIVDKGINVVSSCEELLFPAFRNPRIARALDKACRKSGARVVATGVNPGFVMDLLPICFTGVSTEVQAIHVQRVVNASTRRAPLQRKIGSGLPPAEFRRLFRAGKAGHAGLSDSLALIAHALDWEVDLIKEKGKPVIATKDIRTEFVQVRKGQTCGLHQWVQARRGGKVCITLDLKMYLDASEPHDAIQIEGTPPLNMRVEGGVAGDQATVAALVNAAPRLMNCAAGLLLMTDLAVPSLA